MMKKLSLLLLLFLIPAIVMGAEFKLVGTHLLEYSVFKIDIYQISYFKSANAEKMVLDYKYPVKREHSIDGWKVGLKNQLKNPELAPKAQWFFDHTFDVKSGDKLTIMKEKGILRMYLNDVLKAETYDETIIKMAYEPWLGEKPVDEDLKRNLLGK